MGENGKCCALALGLALGILWSVGVLSVGVANHIAPTYGGQFLTLIDSIYPCYNAQTGLVNLSFGVLWAFVDAFIGGFLLAWIYNLFTRKKAA